MFSVNADKAYAAVDVSQKCNYVAVAGVNPDKQTINCLLTEMARAYDVPAEIVKGIAYVETDWRQYNSNGEPIVSSDGGIGIMQITLYQDYDIEKLKNDIVYNIQAGVEMLDSMFKDRRDLPTINDGDRNYLEHWYFAILAYNGTKPVNSPIVQSTGERNRDAYQEKVYQVIRDYHLLPTHQIPFRTSDFDYRTDSADNIRFVTTNFTSEKTRTTYHLKGGDRAIATADRVNVRAVPSTTQTVVTLAKGDMVTVNGPYVYDQNRNSSNHFVWYPVTTADGTKGYVASNYLEYHEQPVQRFTDVPSSNWAANAIYFLTNKDIIRGYPNGAFGFHDNITRGQAAVMLARAENLPIGSYAAPRFTDVPANHPYRQEIAAVVGEGIFTGVTATTFEPNANLTRAQMAVLLDRLYDFAPVSNYKHPFVDVRQGVWYETAVATLAGNGIVAGVEANRFSPNANVTRAQFAVFMARALSEEFRTN